MGEKTFGDLVGPTVEVQALKDLIAQLPVQPKFKENLDKYFESKKLYQTKECSAFVMGVAFAEYVNKNVDSNSDADMKDYYISRAILANTNMLPLKIGK